MRIAARLLSAVAVLSLTAGVAHAQPSPLADAIAGKLVAKYQSESCDQLAQERKAPKSPDREAAVQRAAELLRTDAALRQSFVSKVAAPIVDKMIVCGFIP
jgi:hypothetical protein